MASSNGKGSKRSYERFKYSDKNLKEAVEAIRNGTTLSAAASKYNVPKSTLHNKFTGKFCERRKMGPKSVLTDAEENCIKKWILGKARVGFPMHSDEVKDAVRRIVEETPRENPFIDNRPGERWMSLFLKRHPEIRKKNRDISTKARACVTEKGLRNWFANLRTFLEENNDLDVLDRPRSIFNGDETGVQTCPKSGSILGAKSEKNFYDIANIKEKECITVFCTFSASGDKIPPMIVFPYKRIPASIARSVPDNWPIGRSDSGWMEHSTFYEYVSNMFYPWCIENNVQFPVLYFLNGHRSHISSELSEFCVEHKIILYCLPPNSKHVMQPCDVAIFKPLKSHWRKVVNKHKQKTQKAVTKGNFSTLFKKAFNRLKVKEETIQNCFKNCGLYPFDENAVDYSKCISIEKANLSKELEDSTISMEDFAAAKKVIEHVIGLAKTESFTKARNSKEGDGSGDPLFALWTNCTDRVEGENDVDTQYLQFCSMCNGYKAPRSHHCRKCGRCVLKMDHHCPWINNCVGHYNHGYFATFLASAVGGCCVSTVILVSWVTTVLFQRNLPFPPPSVFILITVVFTIGLSIGVVFAVGMLLYFQMSAILRNQTGIEDWIIEKANNRRFGSNEVFVHPYSMGKLFNAKQVLNWKCRPVGDGIFWPVIDGCDQYTLTREQLAQKFEKRRRARRYRVVTRYSGSWIPMSHGIKVLCHPPCTDETRIKLQVGNDVVVTRWRRYWLFGEKDNETMTDASTKRQRGWFPRTCVIEVITNGNDSLSNLKLD